MADKKFKMINAGIVLNWLVAIQVINCYQECIYAPNPKTRYFPTLKSYQGNTLSFNPHYPGFEGNFVEFTFNTINKLPRNAFNSFHSNYIIKLTLSGKHISGIDDGTFNTLNCLHFLNLKLNNITKLTMDTFLGLDNLHELDLSHNLLTDLPDLVFSRMVKLLYLNLDHNKIHSLHPMTFYKLSNLVSLNLNTNKIKSVPLNVFSSLNELVDLDLSTNRLMNIEPEKWTGLTSLSSLNLAENILLRFDPSYNFSFTGLGVLNLSSNYLTTLNPFALRKHFPLLTEIDINNNDWKCDELELIGHQLADSRIHLVGRNNSVNNVMNVSCTVIESRIVIQTTTETETVTTSEKTVTSVTESDSSNELENAILMKTNQIYDDVNYIKTLLLYTLLLISVLIICRIMKNLGVFQFCCDKLNGRQRGAYLDNGNVENFVLLRH